MKIILHIGAHRCATTTFQDYLRRNAAPLRDAGIGFWGPRRTRTGLLAGLVPAPGAANGRDRSRRAAGRVRLNLTRSAGRGITHLVISEENMIGSMRQNLLLGGLYCGAGERLARYNQAFEAYAGGVMVNIRALDSYWASTMGFMLARGHPGPSAAQLGRLCESRRSWRDVVTDIACAMPGAHIRVLPFETFAGRPDAQLRAVTGLHAPKTHARGWLNATPRLDRLRETAPPDGAGALPEGSGRWMPFSQSQQAALHEAYADDMMWLRAGADGLATLMTDLETIGRGANPGHDALTRGSDDDDEEGRMAKTR